VEKKEAFGDSVVSSRSFVRIFQCPRPKKILDRVVSVPYKVRVSVSLCRKFLSKDWFSPFMVSSNRSYTALINLSPSTKKDLTLITSLHLLSNPSTLIDGLIDSWIYAIIRLKRNSHKLIVGFKILHSTYRLLCIIAVTIMTPFSRLLSYWIMFVFCCSESI